MDEERKVEVDWVHAPQGVEESSLWVALHDARLLPLEVDSMSCSACLKFEHSYLMKANDLPGDTRMLLTFTGLKAVRAERADPRPGDFEDVLGETNADRAKRIEAYQEKFITKSIDFSTFNEELVRATMQGDSFWVLEPNLLKTSDGVAIRIDGFEGERYTRWSLHAKALSISLSDGRERTLEELLTMGEIFWEKD